jgi:hypothetical protein
MKAVTTHTPSPCQMFRMRPARPRRLRAAADGCPRAHYANQHPDIAERVDCRQFNYQTPLESQ